MDDYTRGQKDLINYIKDKITELGSDEDFLLDLYHLLATLKPLKQD